MKKSIAKKNVGGPAPAIEAVFEAYPQPVKPDCWRCAG